MEYICKYCKKQNFIEKRSGAQNRYFHKIVSILADFTGDTLEDMKCILKKEFGYYHETVNKNTGEMIIVYSQTSKMNKKELSEFTEKIIGLAESYGIKILTSEEYFQT